MEVQHTYRIRHKGIESTPHSLADLRQMWRSGQIDSSTEFKRGDSPVWLDANDLWAELHLDQPAPGGITSDVSLSAQPRPLKPGGPGQLVLGNATAVRLTSVKIPFREVFVLVLKFYLAAILLAALATAAWILVMRSLG